MSEPSKYKEFPDLSNKLSAPTKKSLFERQKAEAEAKRLREEAETAAVYEDFVKSFEDDRGDARSSSGGRLDRGFGESYGSRPPPGPGKRHFAPSGNRGNSGPGSLGPAPQSLSRKRDLDGFRREGRDRERGAPFGARDESPGSGHGHGTAAAVFKASDDEDDQTEQGRAAERAAAKPTIQLSNLPPGTSPAVIKSVIGKPLTVDAVRIIAGSGPNSTSSSERKSMSAIVTLAKDTPASDIDAAVNSLQNRYMGWGYHLTLSRHLSSAVVGALSSTSTSNMNALPFGARPVAQGPGGSLSRAPPPPSIHGRGIAPPTSYNSSSTGYGRENAPLQVTVARPSDLRQLKLIHKTVESIITHGPEFEALLMSRPEVQRQEKWAWIWDARSPGGVWYRWRLWELLTGAKKSRRERLQGTSHRVFDGGAGWLEPEDDLTFEYTTHFEDFITDDDYDSSEEDESGDEGERRQRQRQFDGPPPSGLGATGATGDEQSYLNPLKKAKLVHLLARLPTTTGTLRKGDVARVTAFAIAHAGKGADEVVDMVVENIRRPFAWGKANPDRPNGNAHEADDAAEGESREKEDVSPSKLIGLYVVSDILSSSSTSGVRHAWRYRQLFETALKERGIFEHLGRLEKEYQWGRLRAEKWKRSVETILGLWDGWCVFPQTAQDHFVSVFLDPPSTKEEQEAEAQREAAKAASTAAKSKWKSVDASQPSSATPPNNNDQRAISELEQSMDVSTEDVDGEPMVDEDVDGEPMDEEDLDGEPMIEDDMDGEPMAADDGGATEDVVQGSTAQDNGSAAPTTVETHETEAAKARSRRPRAEDMFADSDEE